MAIKITKKTSTHNTSYKKGRKIEYIFLHYTAGTTSKAGKAIAVANMFKNSTVQASADFIVDDRDIVQYNPDIANRYCWAIGGSKYSTMSTSVGGKYYNKAFNHNSISIEICSNKKNTKSLLATDTDWYFTDEEIDNVYELVMYLMKTYDIDADHVLMHHHRTGKICPNPWCVNEKALKGYNDFIKRLKGEEVKVEKPTTTLEGKMVGTITAKSGLVIREGKSTLHKKKSTIPYGKKAVILEPTGTWYKVEYNGVIGYSSAKYIDIWGIVTSNDGLNIRKGKSSSAAKLGTIPFNKKCEVLDASDIWYKVKFGNIVGYVHSKYLKF